MKLQKISLKNFKGLRSFEIQAPKGESLSISGRNALGKTTIADALTYVLFDKDTQGRSPQNLGIKTVDKSGEVIHNLEHEVEASFIEPDITLRKVYQEKWTRSRGVSSKHLSGHTTDYYVDDEPVKKKEYESEIAEIMSEEQFRILTVPHYFAEQVHWSQRRKVLAKMAGEIDMDEIIESDPELSDYKEILDGKSAESRKKILTEQRKKYLEQIDNIPDRIDENVMAMVEVDVSDLNDDADELEQEKRELEEELAKARSGGGVSDLQVKMEEIESQKQSLVKKQNEKVDKASDKVRKEVRKAREEMDSLTDKLSSDCSKIDRIKSLISEKNLEIESLESEIESATNREPDPKPNPVGQSGTCPYCGQDMPDKGDESDHDAEAEYEEYLAKFNADKAQTIKYLRNNLSQAEAVLKEMRSELTEQEKGCDYLDRKVSEAEKKHEQSKAKRDEVASSFDDVKNTDEYKALQAKQDALEGKVQQIRTNKKDHVDSIQEKISEVSEKLSALEEKRFEVRKNKERQERINELKGELKTDREKLEDAEHGLYVIQRFDVAQAEVITGKVNKKFDLVEWKMFEPQINGGVNDQMCEATVNGVAYGDGLNNAMRIQAGLDIINTLGSHYGKQAPVVVDNAEAINDMNTYDLQVIAMYVSTDKQLKVEVMK